LKVWDKYDSKHASDDKELCRHTSLYRHSTLAWHVIVAALRQGAKDWAYLATLTRQVNERFELRFNLVTHTRPSHDLFKDLVPKAEDSRARWNATSNGINQL
jgi:hypothetical protein